MFEAKTPATKRPNPMQVDKTVPLKSFLSNTETYSDLNQTRSMMMPFLMNILMSLKKPLSQELDLNTMFFSCHSVSDITSKFQEFECLSDLNGLFCSVCHSQESDHTSVFKYECDLESDFTGQA